MSTSLETQSTSSDKVDTQQKREKPKKKYEPLDFYLKDTFVDCKDSVNNWCLGRILERCEDDHTLKVNFDGWSHKWDEWLRFTSSKIAPFRKYSAGYSGQSKYAIRDWKFSIEEIKQKTQKLREVVTSDFTSLTSPHEVTQYFRGEEFVYVDCLLQWGYKKPKEELPFVFKYFGVFFQVYSKFLNLIPDYIQEYLDGIANLDLFLTNQRIALVHCLYELSDSFNKILGLSERLWSEFGTYDSEEYEISICESDEYAGRDITTTWTADTSKQSDDDNISTRKKGKKYSEMICQMINLFGKCGGFDAWLNAFTYHKEENDPSNPQTLPPFKIMMTILTNIYNIHSYLNKDLQAKIYPQIKTAILRRLRYISDKEIKDLDRDVLVRFLNKAQLLLIQHYPQDEIFLLTETAELDLSLRFLTCQYFEKRLRGINEIKELAEKIEVHEDFAKDPKPYSSIYGQKMTKKLNAKMFIDWIYKNKIFELILGDSIHIEIIKRTHEIIKFIARFEKLPLSLLDLLWNACSDKHEAITIGLYNLIVEISENLDSQGIAHLQQKINSIPDEEQNELTLNLIQGFAIRTLPTTPSKLFTTTEEPLDESKFHCVDTLWRLMLDDSKISPVLSESALEGLVTVLKEKQCQQLKKAYIFRGFEKVKKKESVPQCIYLIHNLLSTTYHTHRFDSENSLVNILEQIDVDFDVLDLLITEFEHFHKKMTEIFSKRNSDPTPEERTKIYFGKYSYFTNMHNRLVFLQYLLTNNAYEIAFDINQLDRLWTLQVLNAIWEADRDEFFQWISANRGNQTYGESSVLTKEVIPQFFENILCNHKKFDFINMTPKAFECFQTYFRVANEIKGNVRTTKGSKFILLDLNYEGKDSLWSIFLNCKNQNTINKVVSLLVNCSLRLGPNLEREKRKICEEFTFKCMNLLKEGYTKQNDRLISKSVLLLMNFFDCFEGKNKLEGTDNGDKRPYNINMTVNVVLKPDNTSKNLSMNSTQSIGYLRSVIAEQFKLAVNEFKMYCKGSIIDSDEDDSALYNFPFGGPYVIYKVQVPKNQDSSFHPKVLMTQNSEYIDLLFKLLSEDVQAVNAVWDLLVRLPINEKIKNSLYEVSDSWENLLEVKSSHHLHRLLYCLQIIEEFLLNKEDERLNPLDFTQQKVNPTFRDEKWMQKFYETGGLKALIEILLKPEMTNIKSLISIKCLSIISKIVCFYSPRVSFQNLFGQEKTQQVESETIQRIIAIINNTCEYSLQREQTETEADRMNQPLIKTYNMNYQEPIQVPENLYFESELISYAQSLLLLTSKRNPSLLNIIYEYPKLETMLSLGLIECNNVFLKQKLSHGIFNLMVQFQQADNVERPPHKFLVPILLQTTLQKAMMCEDRSEVFFGLLTNVVNYVNLGEVNLDVDKLLAQLVKFVKERGPKEKYQKDTDIVLHGILSLMRGLFLRFPEKAEKYGQDSKLVSELLQNCLFEIPRRASRKLVPGPKCKSHYSRSAAFKLLAELVKGSHENLKEVINYILPIHKNANWRTKRWVDWHITQKNNEKSSTGYVGLKNLGCICYMNSTIQQLYMIPTFRKSILDVEDKAVDTTPKEDNILYQLKSIFAALNESEKQYFNPKGFCHSFKDYDGNPTNVFEQMDADEFFNMFMDRLENQIKGTKEEHFIKQHFGGVVSNELICKGCPHYSEREESFLTVNLQVKNKKNIDQSLAAFVEGEMLDGDNAYHCAICDKKVNTLKRACLKKLPNHLIMVMKRFEFDFDTMAKVKVNDYCEFPTKLNLEPYTQQGLRKAEKAKKKEQGQEDEQQQEENVTEYPQSYFEYKLVGVVIHLGFADSGHYYSLIQDRELPENQGENWYEFNDHLVSNFDPKDIPSEAFGGEEKWKYFSGNDSSMKEKIKNAYLLFYERIEHCSEDQFTTGAAKKDTPKKDEEGKEDNTESTPTNRSNNLENFTGDERPQLVRKLTSDSTLDSSAIVKKEKEEDGLEDLKNVPKEFLQNLMEKNQKFHLHKNIFSREYFEFIDEIVTQRQFTPNLKYSENYNIDVATNPEAYYDLETLKFAILFILTAIFRDRAREGIIRFLPFVKKNLKQNVPACMWLLEMFSSKKLKIECLLDCPVSDMQRFTVGLLMVAYRVVYEFEGKGANNKLFDVDSKTQLPKTLLANFTNSCVNLIFEAKDNNRDYTEFFKIFCEMASCGHEVAEYLVSKRVVGRLMDFFYEHVSPHNDFFRDMSDVPYNEPSNYELGQPQEEKKKIRTAWEEFMLRGKNRQTSENHSAQKSYVWKTVYTLLRYCKIGASNKRCKWQIGDYDCQLHSNEMTLLTPGPKFIERVINDTHTKIGYRHVAKMYSYLCYEDSKFTSTFIKAIQSGISDIDHPVITGYFRCFATLLTLEDSLSAIRRAELCDCLLKTMDENNNYYVDTDVYSNFMIKIAERVDGVRAWFTANRSKWEWLIDWLLENPTPPFGMMQGSVKYSKKRSFMGMSSLKHDLKEYKARSNVKVNKLRNLAQGTLNNNADAWDSDDDLSEHPFKVGDKVDFLPQGYDRWVTAEVDTNLEEMIHLQFEAEDGDGEQSLLWVSRDVETLAAYRGMQARQEIVDNEMGNVETGNMPDTGNHEGQELFTDGEDSHKGDEGTDNSSEDMNLDIGNH